MKRIRVIICILLALGIACLPLFADALNTERAEILRSGMTIACAGIGLAAGTAIGIGFSLDAIDTPLSNMLLLTIPVAAVGAASGALAGRLFADIALNQQPSFLLSVFEGAGLGLAAGAFIGALTFSTNFAIGYYILEVPEGYWGNPPIPMIAMALVAGGVWGGIFGAMAGAVALPVLSLLMDF
jgi:hypothetical protein